MSEALLSILPADMHAGHGGLLFPGRAHERVFCAARGCWPLIVIGGSKKLRGMGRRGGGSGSRDGDWVLMQLVGGQVSLLAYRPNPELDKGTMELNFRSPADLRITRC